MNRDIIPIDSEGYYHGYIEDYYDNGQLLCKGIYFHGKEFGYFEWYSGDGYIDDAWIGYYLGDKKISRHNKEGYCYIWNRIELQVKQI